MNIGFKITNKVNIRDINKLLFALTNNYRESIIAFLYIFDMFECLLIISISYNSFFYSVSKSLGTMVNVNPKSMQIIIFSDMFLSAVVKHIKMFCLKLLKICSNTNLKFIVLDVSSSANIEPMCNQLIE